SAGLSEPRELLTSNWRRLETTGPPLLGVEAGSKRAEAGPADIFRRGDLMRWTLKVVLFAAALFATASSWAFVPPPETAPAKPMARTVRILFIGNSYTYFNDLPSLFAAFAKATYPNLD